MTIIAKKPENQFPEIPLPEAGTTLAVCCGVWDIGLQKSTFNGEEKIQHKIVIAWELAQLIEVPESEYNGKPYMLTQTYTLSLGDKSNLRRDLESWRGKVFSEAEINNGFDVDKLYGVNCLLGVKHEASKKNDGKTYARISAILPPTKSMDKLVPVRTHDEPPPKWVQEKANNAVNPEYLGDDPFIEPNEDIL